MQPPIFVLCSDGELLVFPSLTIAESALESPDVESGEYADAFDSSGMRLLLTVPVPTRRGRLLGLTTLELTPVVIRPSDVDASARLRELLCERLEDTEAAALETLTARALTELGK